jgi:hypothetical protein
MLQQGEDSIRIGLRPPSGCLFMVALSLTRGPILFGRKMVTSNWQVCSHPQKQIWWSLLKPPRISILLVKAACNLQQLVVPVARNSKIRQAKGEVAEGGRWDWSSGEGKLYKALGPVCLVPGADFDWGYPLATSLHRPKRTRTEPGLSSLKQDWSLHFPCVIRNYWTSC